MEDFDDCWVAENPFKLKMKGFFKFEGVDDKVKVPAGDLNNGSDGKVLGSTEFSVHSQNSIPFEKDFIHIYFKHGFSVNPEIGFCLNPRDFIDVVLAEVDFEFFFKISVKITFYLKFVQRKKPF
jgi:hypothetical protein